MAIGPIQLIVVGFDEGRFTGEIVPELKRLRDAEVIRLVDLLFLRRGDDGDLHRLQLSDIGMDQMREMGAIAGALMGYGADGEEGALAGAEAGYDSAGRGVWDEATEIDIAAELEPGEAVALALIEHRWAIPLRGAIQRAGGRALEDMWIQPDDLVALGAEVAAQVAVLDRA